MQERLWTVLFVVSLIVIGGCGTLNGVNYIVAGNSGSGFLPDMAIRVIGIAECAALFLCAFSRIKQSRRK